MSQSRKPETKLEVVGGSTTPTEIPQAAKQEEQSPPLDEGQKAKLRKEIDLAKALLLPNPESLNATGEQLSIPLVKTPSPLEYFQTHPTIRLTLKLIEPNKGGLDSFIYAVMPPAEAVFTRYKFLPYIATLFPIVIDGNPLTYKVVQVKVPPPGRRWDQWNLSRKLTLEAAVGKWKAMRSVGNGYEACDPDLGAKFRDPVFPDWSPHEWLDRCLGVADLIVWDGDHDVFKLIQHLK
jgi:hypothetical protein